MSTRLVVLCSLFLAACGAPTANTYSGPPLSEPEYRLGVADVIAVDVKDNPGFSMNNAVVRPDGKITLPLVDDIQVVGRSPGEVKKEILKKLEAFIKQPIVTVSVMQMNSYAFFVMGNVRAPNRYTATNLVTVMQALAMAGDVTTFADPENIVILRHFEDGQKRIPFDYSAVVNGTQIDQNIALQSGDIVVVP